MGEWRGGWGEIRWLGKGLLCVAGWLFKQVNWCEETGLQLA